MTAHNAMEFTEADVFKSLCEELSVLTLSKTEAKASLIGRIYKAPVWLALLPESLLDKLGIQHDQVFDEVDLALAARIGARCARRIMWPF